MYQIKTQLQYNTTVEICRLHLQNYKLYESGEYSGTNLAFFAKSTPIRDELQLLLNNLVSTYDISTVILALRSVKMYNYCKKYLKVS
jgi:hypothetical protein